MPTMSHVTTIVRPVLDLAAAIYLVRGCLPASGGGLRAYAGGRPRPPRPGSSTASNRTPAFGRPRPAGESLLRR